MPFYEQFPAMLLDMADTLKYTYHVKKKNIYIYIYIYMAHTH